MVILAKFETYIKNFNFTLSKQKNMKQLTLKIPENKYQFIIELLKNFDYIKIENEEISISEEHKNIVRKRIEASNSNPSRLLNWDKVKSEIKL
jgi:hypothetical protein